MFSLRGVLAGSVLGLSFSAPASAALFCGLPIGSNNGADVQYRYLHDATNAYDFFVMLGVIAKANQFARGKLIDEERRSGGPYQVGGSAVEYDTYLDCPKGGRLFTKSVEDGSYEHWLEGCKFSDYTATGGYSHFTQVNQRAVVREIDVDVATASGTISVRDGQYTVPLGNVSALVPPGTKSVSFDSLVVTGARSMEIENFRSGISWANSSRSETELSVRLDLVAAGGQPVSKLVETTSPLKIDRKTNVIDSGEILLSGLADAEESLLSISNGAISTLDGLLGSLGFRVSSCLPQRHFFLHYNVFDTV